MSEVKTTQPDPSDRWPVNGNVDLPLEDLAARKDSPSTKPFLVPEDFDLTALRVHSGRRKRDSNFYLVRRLCKLLIPYAGKELKRPKRQGLGTIWEHGCGHLRPGAVYLDPEVVGIGRREVNKWLI